MRAGHSDHGGRPACSFTGQVAANLPQCAFGQDHRYDSFRVLLLMHGEARYQHRRFTCGQFGMWEGCRLWEFSSD